MRVIIISAVALILLGIMIFSIHSDSSGGTISDDKGLVQKIDYKSSYFDVQEDWDGFETLVIDIEKFRKAADTGNVSLRLMGKDFNIKIQEKSRYDNETFYTEPIIGINNSRADFYVRENFCTDPLNRVRPGK